MTFQETLQKIRDKLNIGKQSGYYFHKPLIRISFLFILVFGIIVLANDGISQHIYVTCPDDVSYCVNEQYNNCQYTQDWQLSALQKFAPSKYDKYMKEITDWCAIPNLKGGESYGSPPSFLSKYFGTIIVLMLLIMFIINHQKYNRGRKLAIQEEDEN